MTILFLILVVLSAIILGFIILVQNPKGGGLASSVGGIGNQFMGVQQTTDVLEKGTWIFASVIAVLCITSTLFISSPKTDNNSLLNKVNTSGAVLPAAPAATPTVADTTKK